MYWEVGTTRIALVTIDADVNGHFVTGQLTVPSGAKPGFAQLVGNSVLELVTVGSPWCRQVSRGWRCWPARAVPARPLPPRGYDFSANASVKVFWGTSVTGTLMATVTTDATGHFNLLTFPVPTQATGQYTLTAQNAAVLTQVATTTYTIGYSPAIDLKF